MAFPPSISLPSDPFALKLLPLSRISVPAQITAKIELTQLISLRRSKCSSLKASMGSPGFTQQLNNSKLESLAEVKDGRDDIFNDLKDRFLSFKKDVYMKNPELSESLAKVQVPKFMVIACADSRVCPSSILGFQPGEAFTIRNIANLVPTFESGPTEVNAALEFAVNTLLVENILVIGHSCCGGIRALMGMEDDGTTGYVILVILVPFLSLVNVFEYFHFPCRFIKSWVVNAKNAKVKTKAVASTLDFDSQCKHCEKVSINHTLVNLLSYPWIKEKVEKEELSIHGGYYDFTDCSFEKWTLDYRGTELEENGRIATKDEVFWS
ncbi:beta carbonic anhydrase 5, chloroplastic-like isoform X1 [Vicia villosa]|uniref:beta carbonic anhydrase 5, chloroplastic-like isoform X1 n=1 Tax=Vicia villosa TaxID=3911 RepID=UPI00273C1066|nr:beta carbonic anhydrase 5, chloroplastic-like isoform X1 [Vicia villosa]